jgi:hypothetical protein
MLAIALGILNTHDNVDSSKTKQELPLRKECSPGI